MTPNKEDYLKEINKLGGESDLVANKQIAEALKVAPASVSEMLGKLEKEGLVEYAPYKGIRLTLTGKQQSSALLRNHRLWEVFLLRCLGYSWSEVHEDAELLEHVTSPHLAQKLDDFLHNPDVCPHGAVIPGADGTIRTMNLQKLSRMSVGETSAIRKVTEEKELLDYLQDLGVRIGSTVTVLSIGPYEGPFSVELDGQKISLSYKAACHIDVDALKK